MKALSGHELWQRVRGLEGRTIYTIDRHRANIVSQVTSSEVRLLRSNGEPRLATPRRTDIMNTYAYLLGNGRVTGEDFARIPGNLVGRRVSRIVLAILRDAVPDQIEKFHRQPPSVPLAGIRLRG